MRARLLLLLLLLAMSLPAPAQALPPPGRVEALARGLNVTHWFRFPPAWTEAHFTGYVSDADLAGLRRAGITFLRLPLDPAVMLGADGQLNPLRARWLEAAIRRIHAAGLAVSIHPHPPTSTGFDQTEGQATIIAFWRQLLPIVARLPPERLFLEIMSEPVFRGRDADWHRLQGELAALLRAGAPRHTLIATGAEWSSIEGLLRLAPLADPNVIYTFHFYWPMAFTHQGANWVGPMFQNLRGIPWPGTPEAACRAALPPQPDEQAQRTADWYCRAGFDGARLAREIARARAWADRHGVAVWVGEFGGGCYVTDRATRLRFLTDVRTAIDGAGFGWALWGLDNCQGIGADRMQRNFALPPDMQAALGLSRR